MQCICTTYIKKSKYYSKKDFEISRGMRIAQMVISKVEQFNLVSVDQLDTTERGQGGFGSTGNLIKKDEG